jgi:hypothetical protein
MQGTGRHPDAPFLGGSVPTTSTAATLAERVGRLRSLIENSDFGTEVNAELLPSDIASTGEQPLMDFSDWQDFNQWPQSY